VIAIHEAGHAICSYYLPESPEIEEINVARDSSAALGYVRSARERSYVTTRADLLAQLCVLLGGRVAEQMLMGEGSTGAQDDLTRATKLARLMVEELGMSEALGLRCFSATSYNETGSAHSLPEELSSRVEAEISALVEGQRERAMALLEEHRSALEALVEHLIKHERCERAELERLIEAV
jgi:cell division protease FtsH